LLKDINVELLAPYPVESETVHIYMNACDVLLFPSIEEGSPNLVKEAITCNCPIVATDVGDVPERIKGIAGCYLSTYDPEDFTQNIKKALDFNGRTKGREALAYLDNRKVAHSITAIYNRLFNNNREMKY
jgi:teichuronic acid biosynthesis glycosyltransferase TuaC